jgi:type I restriction enzyme R subunit/putative DNA methylase
MKPRSKREYFRQLVADKNQWSRPLTDEERALGFLGWHERGYLPHCDFSGLVQFVTFRLADSMPASRRGEWEHLLKIEDVREKRTKLEKYLDRGAGECHLHDTRIAQLAEDALLHFHNERYELLAWCVMPNHVPALAHVWQTPMGKMVQSWKRYIATQAEAQLSERRSPTRRVSSAHTNAPARRAALQTLRWEREYWDTFMRDEEQERTAIRYIENNPVKAKLCRVPEQWLFSSARFRDEYRRLVIPSP